MRKNGKHSLLSQSDDENPPVDVTKLMGEDGGAVDHALRRGVRKALLRHKLLGESIVVWRNGKVVVLKPDEI